MNNKKDEKRYSDDFRKMVVDLYNSGHSVKDLSSEHGLSEAAIYTWIKKFTPVELENESSITPDDLKELQKRILELQEENAILKKAMAYSKKSK